MGYRSDVILAVGPEVMPQFMITMAKSPQARELCWADHDEMIKDYNGEKGAFLFRWGGIKWSLLAVLSQCMCVGRLHVQLSSISAGNAV